jgi:rod shape determining protein RodA
MGWLNIYFVLVIYRRYVPETVLFILLTIPLIFIILAIDGKFYEKYASIILLFLCYH